MDNIHVVKETTLTVKKKPLVLILGLISLQTRTKLKKLLKKILNCCKLEIVFKNKTKLGNKLHFKDLTSNDLYKLQCGLWNDSYYFECVKHFNVRNGEDIGISPRTKKQVKPKNSSVASHLLFCNYSASYDDFNILVRENKTFFLELKKSLLIMRKEPSLNKNITSPPLYLFNRP